MLSTTPRYSPGRRLDAGSLPDGSGLEASRDILGFTLTGRFKEYTQADTWYPSWAADGHLYSPFTDGQVANIAANSAGGGVANTGYARIEGSDPLNLTVVPLGTEMGSARPYGGRYPSACLMLRGVWYFGTYCLDKSAPDKNWDVLGPFVGFQTSTDFGQSWTHGPHTPAKPLFGESGKNGSKVKFGSPHFVDFGQELEHAPEAYAYLVAHGGRRPESNLSWISGDEVYIARVRPSLATINDASAYEFLAGTVAGKACWTKSLSEAEPVVQWPDHLGCATITYNAPLKRYIMCISHGWPTTATTNSLLLEAQALEGPWRVFAHLPQFGSQAYFVTIPSRFISGDGLTMWLCYSANYSNHFYDTPQVPEDPVGSSYSMCLHELKLELA